MTESVSSEINGIWTKMGGYGSGRQGGWPTIERTQSVKLSIDDVMRGWDGTDVNGRKWTWSGDVPGELISIVRPQGNYAPLVELRYRFGHVSRDTGDQVQYVDVGFSPCRFGGPARYFIEMDDRIPAPITSNRM